MDTDDASFSSPMWRLGTHCHRCRVLEGAAVLLPHTPRPDVADPLHRAYPVRLHPALPDLPGLELAGWRGAFCIWHLARWSPPALTFLDEAFLTRTA